MSVHVLFEHCTSCCDGLVTRDGWAKVCTDCNGTTRRRRGTHDPRSAIDFEPEFGPSPFYGLLPLQLKLQRAAELARVVRDPTNPQPLSELLNLIESLSP